VLIYKILREKNTHPTRQIPNSLVKMMTICKHRDLKMSDLEKMFKNINDESWTDILLGIASELTIIGREACLNGAVIDDELIISVNEIQHRIVRYIIHIRRGAETRENLISYLIETFSEINREYIIENEIRRLHTQKY